MSELLWSSNSTIPEDRWEKAFGKKETKTEVLTEDPFLGNSPTVYSIGSQESTNEC